MARPRSTESCPLPPTPNSPRSVLPLALHSSCPTVARCPDATAPFVPLVLPLSPVQRGSSSSWPFLFTRTGFDLRVARRSKGREHRADENTLHRRAFSLGILPSSLSPSIKCQSACAADCRSLPGYASNSFVSAMHSKHSQPLPISPQFIYSHIRICVKRKTQDSAQTGTTEAYFRTGWESWLCPGHTQFRPLFLAT